MCFSLTPLRRTHLDTCELVDVRAVRILPIVCSQNYYEIRETHGFKVRLTCLR